MSYTANDLYEIAKKAGEEEFNQIMRDLHTAASKGYTDITVPVNKPVVLTMLKNLGIKHEGLSNNHYKIIFN